jgi:hypothetical protein
MAMGMKVLLATVLFSVIGLSSSSEGFAAIYKYTDKDGTMHFADNLQSIPAQYRGAAKIVSGKEKDEHKGQTTQTKLNALDEIKQVERMIATAWERLFIEKKDTDSFGSRVLVSAIVVLSALFAFTILKILDADHKKSVAITRVVIIWGVSVFLLFAHAGDVVAVFRLVGNKIERSKQQAEEKGKNAAKDMKQLNSLLEQVEKTPSSDPREAGQEKKDER